MNDNDTEFFNYAFDAIFVLNANGLIREVNPAACNLTGYLHEELILMNIHKLFSVNDSIKSIIQHGFKAGMEFNSFILRKEGVRQTVKVRVNDSKQEDQEKIIFIVREEFANNELENGTNKQRVIFEALNELAVVLMQKHKIQDVLHSIMEYGCRFLETSSSYAYMLSDQQGIIEIKVGYGNYSRHVGFRRQIGTGLSGRVWQTGEPKIIDDYQQWAGKDNDLRWKEVLTAIGIPLKARGRVVATIGFDVYNHSWTYCPEDFSTFQRLTEVASLAIENAMLVEELQGSKEQFLSLFSNMVEGVALHEPVLDQFGNFANYRIIDVNSSYSKLTGLRRSDVLGKLATEAYHTERAPFIDQFVKTALLREPGYFETYYPKLDKYFSMSVIPWRKTGFATIFADITDRKQTEQKLLYLSYHDTLTGLYNRAYFESGLKQLGVASSGAAIIIADVDGLKVINDMFGHEEGDRLLRRAAELLRKNSRDNDLIARIGGDEFAIIMENVTEKEVERRCSQIRKCLCKNQVDHQSETPLHLSLGYAISIDSQISPTDLFRVADNKMYRDKLYRRVNSRGSIVQTLKQMLAERDYLTEGHGERLQDMVVCLAKAIGWTDSDVGDLRLLAQFHDIGKVGIPDRILHKPGALLPEERDEMNLHSEIGQRIAQSSEELMPIADWILKHHEQWGGGGYPLGLKGEEIPIECRILAVVDAYDAMTSDRPYRNALSHEVAISEIRRCAGTQFDPFLVDEFIKLFYTGKSHN